MKRTRLVRAMGISLIAGSMAFGLSAQAAQGLYSADELMDADVYDSNGEEIGEVEDILMSDDMSVHSLVIKTGDVLGLGGRDVVAERGSFTVRLEQDDKDDDEFDDQDYEVHMASTKDEVKSLPEYDESWWNQTRQGLRQAWENTKETSRSAWEDTKQATSSAWHNVKEGAEKMSDRAEDAVDN
ncbi:PRC-barrel domain-containing protein [Marinobacter segnicrescens]|uniref:PRC-barrel domain-containing protein n=1 Tax=Marinobacter segnicrescens TaxID=430453 RepID=A0A1I0I5E0_9GAMM|nr:PRC-barrel domain-containing protein [Marinobacter segnicrescens]SET90985.1 PRC-barrel domain-containing protein [Marinobacter segnicrescens]